MNHSYIIDIDYTRDHQRTVLLNEEVDRKVPHQLLLEEGSDKLQPAIIRKDFMLTE
jgi:hypothetical protein